MEIYLLRHEETNLNLDEKYQGVIDNNLNTRKLRYLYMLHIS